MSFAKALDATAKALHDFNDIYHDVTLTTQLFVLYERFWVCYPPVFHVTWLILFRPKDKNS